MILSWSEYDRTNQQSFKINGGSSCWLGVNRPDGHQECIPWICETSPDLVLRWWRTAKKQKQNPSLNYICFATGMHLLPFCNITQLKKRRLQLMKKKKSQHPSAVMSKPKWITDPWCRASRQLLFILRDRKDQRHILISLCWTRRSSETAAITLIWVHSFRERKSMCS